MAGVLSEEELEFLRSHRLARLATIGPGGWPHVMPVMHELGPDGAIEFDADGIKLRNLRADPRVALVVDSTGPRRGVAVQGEAQLIGPERVRLTPRRRFSWGF